MSKDYRLGKGDQLRKMRTAAPRGGRAHYPRTRLSIVSIVLEGIESRGCGHGARRNTESKTRSIGRGHVEIRTRNVFFSLSLSLTEFFGHNRNENLVHRYFQARPFVSSCTQGSRCPQGESQTFRSNLTERKQFLANRLTTEEGVHDSNFST